MFCLQNISGLSYDPDENLWTVDDGCWNLTQLQNVTFTLGSHQFVLRPDQYVLAVRNPASKPPASHEITDNHLYAVASKM